MKKYTIGFIAGILMMLSTNAYAAIGDTVTAVFAQFTYKVNGEAKPIDSPVLVYEGNSYLRTTDIANLLGFDVTYKADGRTIEFTGGPAPTSTPTPTTPEPTQTPTVEQSTEPAASTEPTQEPAQTQPQPVDPTPTEPAPEPPAPDNTAACQAIRDDYAGKIAMVQYGPGSLGKHKQQVLLLEYERNQKLSASGCQ